MSDVSPGYQASLQRGRLLRMQGRYAEAEKYFQQAIADHPDQPDAYYELAFCYCNWAKHGAQALRTIDRAIALGPDRSDFLALRAWILGNLERNKEAIQVAEQALAMDPFSLLALNAQTRAYIDQRQWREAETGARHTLSFYATNEVAANFLAIALRQQGRLEESRAVSASVLADEPESSLSQATAGWSALHDGDHRQANVHFLEALRLDPNNEHARHGLLHSFNSRVWIYRLYFRVIAWMGKHGPFARFLFLVMIYLGYRTIIVHLNNDYGMEGIHWAVVVWILYLVLFGFGRSFGNLFLLLDPFARHALTFRQKCWSTVAGTIYGLGMFYEYAVEGWLQFSVLTGILLIFLWGVAWPQMRDMISPPKATGA